MKGTRASLAVDNPLPHFPRGQVTCRVAISYGTRVALLLLRCGDIESRSYITGGIKVVK